MRDTPISENAIVGAAVGSAVTGMRPIAEMQFMDFITLGMEQLVLQGAKIRYMFGGKASVPMVLRMPAGSGTGAAAQHSESLESWLVNVPGLKVVAPSTPYDAKGLLLAAIADDNPVMFVENKLLYKVKGPVPEEPYIVPLGKAAVRRPGKDLTVVATSIMVVRALEAAAEAGAGRDRAGGDRPAHAQALRRRDDHRVGEADGPAADGARGAADRRLRRRDRRHDRPERGVCLPGGAHRAPGWRGRADPLQPQAGARRRAADRRHRVRPLAAWRGPRSEEAVMPIAVIMPKFEMAQETGKVGAWLKAEGDFVRKGEPILEVETDKVSMEVEVAGRRDPGRAFRPSRARWCPIGQPIAYVLRAGRDVACRRQAQPAQPARARQPAANSNRAPAASPAVAASPLAARMAAELGIDLSAVTGTGPHGQVTREDVESHLRDTATRAQPSSSEAGARRS